VNGDTSPGAPRLTSVVLALPPSTAGRSPEGSSAGSPPRDVLRRLVGQLRGFGAVVVLVDDRVTGSVTSSVPPEVTVVGVRDPADAAGWLARQQQAGELLVLPADVVTGELAIRTLADEAAAGTWALVAPATEGGVPVRVTRGRVRSAGSAVHQVQHPTHRSRGVVRIGAGDRGWFAEVAARLQGHLRAGTLPPDPDPVPYLLVAMLRSGRALRAHRLPDRLPWARAWSEPAARAALVMVAATDEERVRLDAAVKDEDGFFTTFFVSPYSRHLARWCARRGITPNQVTSASMAVAVAAALAFADGGRAWAVLGAVLLQLSFTLDCVDGQLARYTRRFSAFGAWLDSVFDRGKEYVVFVGLAVGGVRAGDAETLWLLAVAALALQTFRHTLDFGYAAEQEAALAVVPVQPLTAVDEGGLSFWEPVPATAAVATGLAADAPGVDPATPGTDVASPRDRNRPARRVIELLRAAERVPVLKWAKRIVVLPIGERFLLISLVTPLVSPRGTFVALLLWGAVATAYTFGGRLVRSLS
jgi:phosphatidylglycerophosphate synthase